MYATRLVEGLLGQRDQNDSKVSGVMADCASLLVALNKSSQPERQLKVIKELQDLSNQYPFLPLGKPAITKIMDLIKHSRNPRTDSSDGEGPTNTTLPAVARPCIQLLKNVSRTPPANASIREKQAVSENLSAFVAESENVLLLMELVGETDPYIQLGTVVLLTNILSGKKDRTQQIILSKPTAVNRLVALLEGTGDMVRNEALLLLRRLIQGNATIQKIVAFDGVFDKVISIAENEGYVLGGMIVIDILKLVATLVANNSSNQTLFVETGCVARLVPFLRKASTTHADAGAAFVERRMQILDASLEVLEHLLPSNHRVAAAQDLCPALLQIASSVALPFRVKAYALELIGRLIDSRARNQASLVSATVTIIPIITDLEAHLRSGGGVEAKEERRPALVYILNLALGHDPASVSGVHVDIMAASHYALRCLFRKNFGGQAAVCQALSYVANTYDRGGTDALNPVRLFARTLLQALTMDTVSRHAAHNTVQSTKNSSPAGAENAGNTNSPNLFDRASNTWCPVEVWTAQSIIVHAMRMNNMAKQALLAAPPKSPSQSILELNAENASASGGISNPSKMSVFQRIVHDLLDWEIRAQPPMLTSYTPTSSSQAPLSFAFATEEGGAKARLHSPRARKEKRFVKAQALAGRLLVIIEALDGSPKAVFQLMATSIDVDMNDYETPSKKDMKKQGVSQNSAETDIPPALELLINMGRGSSVGENKASSTQVVISRGLACMALVMCLRHAVEIKQKSVKIKQQTQPTHAIAQTAAAACAERLHQFLVRTVTTSLPVPTLKANLTKLAQTLEFIHAMRSEDIDICPRSSSSKDAKASMKARVSEDLTASSDLSERFVSFNLFDSTFVSRYQKILSTLDSLLLSLLTAAWSEQALTGKGIPSIQTNNLQSIPVPGPTSGTHSPSRHQHHHQPLLEGGHGPHMQVESLKHALQKAVIEGKQAKKTSNTLAGQLKRALEAIKMLEERIKLKEKEHSKAIETLKAANGGTAESPTTSRGCTMAIEEKVNYTQTIQELEQEVAQQQRINDGLKAKIAASCGYEDKIAQLENKLAEITEEHEDLLVLLATEDLDKSQLLNTMESLRQENVKLRQSLGPRAQGQPEGMSFSNQNGSGAMTNGHGSSGPLNGAGGRQAQFPTRDSNSNEGTSDIRTPQRKAREKSASSFPVADRRSVSTGHAIRSLPEATRSAVLRNGSMIVTEMEGGTPIRMRRDPIDQLP